MRRTFAEHFACPVVSEAGIASLRLLTTKVVWWPGVDSPIRIGRVDTRGGRQPDGPPSRALRQFNTSVRVSSCLDKS